MCSNRVISIFVLAVFSFTLGLELFSSHDVAVSCGTDAHLSSKAEQLSAPKAVLATNFENPMGAKEVPCSDPCDQGYCHFGHCFHITIASFSQINKMRPFVKVYGSVYERSFLAQHPASIFRPPIS